MEHLLLAGVLEEGAALHGVPLAQAFRDLPRRLGSEWHRTQARNYLYTSYISITYTNKYNFYIYLLFICFFLLYYYIIKQKYILYYIISYFIQSIPSPHPAWIASHHLFVSFTSSGHNLWTSPVRAVIFTMSSHAEALACTTLITCESHFNDLYSMYLYHIYCCIYYIYIICLLYIIHAIQIYLL